MSPLFRRIAYALFFVLIFAASCYGERLVWDANSESNLAGYKVHRGVASGVYTVSVDVGNVTEYPLVGLDPLLTYYYAVTAYNTNAQTSGYSNEVIRGPPAVGIASATDVRVTWQEITKPMAAVVNNSAKKSSAVSATSLTTDAFAVGGANRVLYVMVGSGANTPVAANGVKWGGSGGTALTQIGTSKEFAEYGYQTLWRLIAPTAQTSSVYATWPSAQDERWIIAVAVEDANQTTPNNTVAEIGVVSDTAPTVNATSVSGDLVLDFASILHTGESSPYITEGASQTALQKFGAGVIATTEDAGASWETAIGISTTMSWSKSGGITGSCIHALAVNAAASGGATAIPNKKRISTLLRR
jgi:hypothetical protein